MKKSNPGDKSTSSQKKSARQAARKKVNLAEVREQITNLVGNKALTMVGTTMAEVNKGHYAALKYLFEVVGLYPATTSSERAPEEHSLARTLLKRLGLPEEPVVESEGRESNESEEPAISIP